MQKFPVLPVSRQDIPDILVTVFATAITVSGYVIVQVFPFGQTQHILFYIPIPHILILAHFAARRRVSAICHCPALLGTQHKIILCSSSGI